MALVGPATRTPWLPTERTCAALLGCLIQPHSSSGMRMSSTQTRPVRPPTRITSAGLTARKSRPRTSPCLAMGGGEEWLVLDEEEGGGGWVSQLRRLSLPGMSWRRPTSPPAMQVRREKEGAGHDVLMTPCLVPLGVFAETLIRLGAEEEVSQLRIIMTGVLGEERRTWKTDSFPAAMSAAPLLLWEARIGSGRTKR